MATASPSANRAALRPPGACPDPSISRGEVAEWSIAPHSKCGLRKRNVGSNPTLSARWSTHLWRLAPIDECQPHRRDLCALADRLAERRCAGPVVAADPDLLARQAVEHFGRGAVVARGGDRGDRVAVAGIAVMIDRRLHRAVVPGVAGLGQRPGLVRPAGRACGERLCGKGCAGAGRLQKVTPRRAPSDCAARRGMVRIDGSRSRNRTSSQDGRLRWCRKARSLGVYGRVTVIPDVSP